MVMKVRFQIIGLIGVIALSNTSCVANRLNHSVTLEEASKIPPFEVTLEKIDISYRFIHPFELATEVDLYSKNQSGYQICFSFFPANQSVIDFAHTLQEGQQYSFPQVFKDYLKASTKLETGH
jgi:hypothetical protein